MVELLFNANGRIARHRFWQGLVVLTVITVLITAASAMVNPYLSLLGLLAVYPYVCVYGKRLHDIGTTAWWVIAVWVGSILVGVVLGMVLVPIFVDAETISMQQEIMERLMTGDSEGAMEGMKIVSVRTLPVNLVSAVATNAILGTIVGFIATQPQANKHGPAPDAGSGDVFN